MAMEIEADRMFPRETGGVLVGYHSAGVCVITEIIGPGPLAVHEDYRFVPDAEYQDREIERSYETSGRTIVYLGDWHTHPAAQVAHLSRKDRNTLRLIARYKNARMSSPTMIILNGMAGNWQFNAWQLQPRIFRSAIRGVQLKSFDARNLEES